MEHSIKGTALLAAVLLAFSAQPETATASEVSTAKNNSVATLCLEEDNINVPLWGNFNGFTVVATHPKYVVGIDNCVEDFTDCPPPSGMDFSFAPLRRKLYDDGITAVWVVRKDLFWRPGGMTVSVDGAVLETVIHRIEIARKVADEASWPIFCALYSDGNLRLIPHPKPGATAPCFGTSVIVGPAAEASRPLAEIASIDYNSSTETLTAYYSSGGSATLHVGAVDRTQARVKVGINYPTSLPFCTVRSNFVADGKSDADHVDWVTPAGAAMSQPIMIFPDGQQATSWVFNRKTRSTQRTSAPDIEISGMDSRSPVVTYQAPRKGKRLKKQKEKHRGTAVDDCGVSQVHFKVSGNRWRIAKLDGTLWNFKTRARRDFKGKKRNVKIKVRGTDIYGNTAITKKTFRLKK